MDAFKTSTLTLGLFIGLGYNAPVSAGTPGSIDHANFYLSAIGSVFWPSLPNELSVNNGANAPSPYNTDRYSVDSKRSESLGVQLGHEWRNNQQWFPSYGFGFQYMHYWLQTINGTITQYALPQFENYSYSWQMSADVFSLYSKVNVLQYGRFSPFVTAGVGVSKNRAQDFHEQAFSGVTPRIPPGFSNHSHHHMTYNLGAGLDYTISPKCAVLIAYNFQDLGSLYTSNGLQTWSGDALTIKSYHLNMLVFGVIYRFDFNNQK